jgi:hypothetical protein
VRGQYFNGEKNRRLPLPSEVESGKNVFPKMPSDVFDQWILKGIEWYGWKFASPDQPTVDTNWDNYFGRKTLAFFAAADWNLSLHPISFNSFFFDSRQRADWILKHATEGFKTPTANIHNSARRFRTFETFVRENRTIPKPMIGYWFGSQIDLVDGNHRLAALIHIFGFEGTICAPIWMASAPKF